MLINDLMLLSRNSGAKLHKKIEMAKHLNQNR